MRGNAAVSNRERCVTFHVYRNCGRLAKAHSARAPLLIRRFSHGLLRLLAVLVTALTVAFALFAWRIASGPLPLEWLTPYIATALSDEEQGMRVTVGGATINRCEHFRHADFVQQRSGAEPPGLAKRPCVDRARVDKRSGVELMERLDELL